MAISFNQNFISGGSVTIPLTADIITDAIEVSGIIGSFCIQAVSKTGLNGTPTWSLEASLTGEVDDFIDYDINFSTDLTLNEWVRNGEVGSIIWFRLNIKAADNTTGSSEFLITAN